MRVLCKKHGASSGELVSGDLAEKIASELKIAPDSYIEIDYESDGEIVLGFYLDKETDSGFGFTQSQRIPIPQDYPAFVNELKPVCSRTCGH
jgi:hypothetical protein